MSLLTPPCEEYQIEAILKETCSHFSDHVAMESRSTRVTYAELHDLADQVREQLQRETPEECVPIALLFEHGPAAIGAMLGALQANRIYLPLEASEPPRRLRRMIEESGATTVLCDELNAPLAQSIAETVMLPFALKRASIARPLEERVSPDSTAYLMCTSGSTGGPKCVMQTRRNLLHFVRAYADSLRLGPRDRVSMLYGLGFSAANMDIYGCVLKGATLCMFDVRTHGAEAAVDWLADARLTVIHTVPTLFRFLFARADRKCFESLRAIDLGGEAVYAQDVELLRQKAPNCVLVNHYAATEASVIARLEVGRGDAVQPGVLPVGFPAPGVEIEVRAANGTPLGANEAGAIVVRSPFLSPGYWRRPELTAVCFGADSDRPQWRTYNTGDVGRLDERGVLTVLGRCDTRVKVRGHTVDLNEVEVALRMLPCVHDVAVTTSPGHSGHEHIVAHVVGFPAGEAALRRALAEMLPAYMMPAELRFYRSLPNTHTGKVDRVALSQQQPDEPRSCQYSAQSDDIESIVAAACSRVLGEPIAEPNADFFVSGGDSLNVVELLIELRTVLGIEIGLPDILRDSTVRGIAATARARRQAAISSGGLVNALITLRDEGTRPAFFLVHGRHGQAFVSPAFLRAVGDDRPVHSFRARGLEPGERPRRRIVDMASDFVAAMRAKQPRGPYLLGALCAGGIIAQEMACQLRDARETVSNLVLFDPPFPPRDLPLKTRLLNELRLRMIDAPLRPLNSGDFAQKTLRRLQSRARQGRTAFRATDSAQRDAAVRVAVALERALLRHRARVYEGPVHVIGSERRLSGSLWRSDVWRRVLRGPLELTVVAVRHGAVLDPSNRRFTGALQRALDRADSA